MINYNSTFHLEVLAYQFSNIILLLLYCFMIILNFWNKFFVRMPIISIIDKLTKTKLVLKGQIVWYRANRTPFHYCNREPWAPKFLRFWNLIQTEILIVNGFVCLKRPSSIPGRVDFFKRICSSVFLQGDVF